MPRNIAAYINSKLPITQVVQEYAKEKKLSGKTKPIIAFANAILETQTLTRGNVTKLIELDQELLDTSAETAGKINQLCLRLLLPGKDSAEINEISQELAKSSDPLANIRFLQYLDLLSPLPSDNTLIQDCALLANRSEIDHESLLLELQSFPQEQRLDLFKRALLVLQRNPSSETDYLLKTLSTTPLGLVSDDAVLKMASVLGGIQNAEKRELIHQIITSLPPANLTEDDLIKVVTHLRELEPTTLQSTLEIVKVIKKRDAFNKKTTLTTQEIIRVANQLNLTGRVGQKAILEVVTLLPEHAYSYDNLITIYNLVGTKDPRSVSKMMERIHEMSPDELAAFVKKSTL